MGKGILFIALDQEKVVGMQSLIPYTFVKNNIKHPTFKSEDSLIHREYRGLKIYKELYKTVFDYVGDGLLWGYTHEKDILNRLGNTYDKQFTLAMAATRIVFPWKIKMETSRWAKSLILSALACKRRIRKSIELKKKNELALEELDISQAKHGELSNFLGTLSHQNPNILFPNLTITYLKWRLEVNPNIHNYKILVNRNNQGDIIHFSIISTQHQKANILVCLSIEQNEIGAFIQSMIQYLFDQKLHYIYHWMSSSNSLNKRISDDMINNGLTKIKQILWIGKNQGISKLNGDNLYHSGLLTLY